MKKKEKEAFFKDQMVSLIERSDIEVVLQDNFVFAKLPCKSTHFNFLLKLENLKTHKLIPEYTYNYLRKNSGFNTPKKPFDQFKGGLSKIKKEFNPLELLLDGPLGLRVSCKEEDGKIKEIHYFISKKPTSETEGKFLKEVKEEASRKKKHMMDIWVSILISLFIVMVTTVLNYFFKK